MKKDIPPSSGEEAILDDFRAGRLDAFYREVYPAVLLFAVKFLDDRAGFLAEDCVQDAVFDAWKRREGFRSLRALKAFLYTSVRHDAVSISRKERSRRRYLSLQGDDLFFTTSVIEQETLSLLYNALNGLPARERQVLEMSFVEGLKGDEIAEKLGISGSSVKKYKASALRLLRRKLAPAIFFALLAGIS
ncbi:MAG: sigma-70 family RNA polymerase sigma factor [Odoribacteraceae bacterium]|jgi:RNA polymerase sigma-70 factor (ECF subfamily)|nr:sigma-70 family RNA polymerase sigma factor [Odoribacteraceae bacterium]